MLVFMGVASKESLAGLFLKIMKFGEKFEDWKVLINENKFVEVHRPYFNC